MTVSLLVCPAHGYVGENISACPTCSAPLRLSARAADVRPQFSVCCLVTETPREDMPEGTVKRVCRDCQREVWLSPSTQNVEAEMGCALPSVCCECFAPKPRDMGFWTVDGEREAAERRARRRRRQ